MKNFIAIVRSTAGVLDKFQDFDTQAEADTHVAQYGGWVAPNPGGNNKNYWVINEQAKTLTYDQVTQDANYATRAAEEVQNNRRRAYQEEADPLFFEEQRGEVSAGTYAAKVAEIKARFPK